MKRKFPHLLTLLCLLICFHSNGQSIEIINKNLIESFNKIQNGEYDSLDIANKNFEALLLKYTSSNPSTIIYPFKNLADSNLMIRTSADGLFRIYSWYDLGGGTARNYYNVFQYRSANKVYSTNLRKTPPTEEDYLNPFYAFIDDIKVENKTYYVTQNTIVASSALYAFSIKIFSIDNGKLNDKAKLIKTKNGIRNELSYTIDWSETINRNSGLPMETMEIKYDSINKIIYIPLITEDDKITAKRIRYKFNGIYFVKI